MIIGIGILLSFIMGFLGRYVAKEKNRSKAEGFWLGFLFSILGVIIVALLPTKEKRIDISGSKGLGLTFWFFAFLFMAILIIWWLAQSG